MRDVCQLKWWSMIQATGYYGWGVDKTALDATHFWGITVCLATRDRCLLEICHDLRSQQSLFFGRKTAALFTIDNYMKLLKLRTQRSGMSTTQLPGTMKMLHKIFPFIDTSWDGKHVEMNYDHDSVRDVVVRSEELWRRKGKNSGVGTHPHLGNSPDNFSAMLGSCPSQIV